MEKTGYSNGCRSEGVIAWLFSWKNVHRQKSGIESDSLPGRHNKDGSTILKMERGEKYETENRHGLLAECPARRQRHTREKLVLLDKDVANLKELRRLNGEGTIN